MTRLALVILGILLFPAEAWAWGPAAHIDVAVQLLAGSASIGSQIQQLIARFPLEFVYGSLAADVIMAKNLALEEAHCHSFKVALGLLDVARNTADELGAFMLGYLCHLGADVVAHNQFVPGRLVACYRHKGAGHLYWEARFDRKLLDEQPQIRETWLEISRLDGVRFERFLVKHLQPTLFSNALSAKIFKRSLSIQRHAPWQRAVHRIEVRSRYPLLSDEINEWRLMSLRCAASVLDNLNPQALADLDPCGLAALDEAKRMRKMLRGRLKHHGKKFAPITDLDRFLKEGRATYVPRNPFEA